MAEKHRIPWCSEQTPGPSINSEQSPNLPARFDAGVCNLQPMGLCRQANGQMAIFRISPRQKKSSNRSFQAPLYLVLPIPDRPRCAAAAVQVLKFLPLFKRVHAGPEATMSVGEKLSFRD